MNSITLLGRTTSAIELKQTSAGKSVTSFSLAVKRPLTKDTTDFFTIVAWDKQAELLSRYVNKGNQVCIRGHLTTRTWDDKQGNKRTTVEVVANDIELIGGKEEKAPVTSSYGQQTVPKFEEIKADADLPF